MQIMMWLLIVGLIGFASADFEYNVTLTNTGPVTLGENVSITATLTKNGVRPDGNFIYVWIDDAVPEHKQEIEGDAQCTWTVSYPSNLYNEAIFSVQVTVYEDSIYDYPKGVNATTVDIMAASPTTTTPFTSTTPSNTPTLLQKMLRILRKILKKLWPFLSILIKILRFLFYLNNHYVF